MQKTPIPTVLRHLRQLMGRTATASVTDGELLTRFVARQEEAAFTTLMERHGGMVLGVCRRLLDHHDAEDVVQATFLLLVRKAMSIRKYESVGSWLHGVAYRLAAKARAQGAQRRHHERHAADLRDTAASSETAWRELQQVLDEELQRLPERYRLPLIHCCLEEQTHEEAASALGVPVGTVKSRLVRGKERLRKRLARRGMTLSAPALATFLAVNGAASAGLPPLLSQTTTQVAILVASGQAVAGAVSAKVLPLVEGGMSVVTASHMKPGVVVLILGGLVAGGAAAIGWSGSGHQGGELPQALETARAQPDEPAPRPEDMKGQDVDPPVTFPPSEALTANLNWHNQTRPDEIRMSWFLRGDPGIALLCRIDLAKGKVHTEREVFQHATQSTKTHEPTQAQLNIMRDLVKSLPMSQKNLDLSNVVLVSVAQKDKAQTYSYNRLDLPASIQRLYDLSGAYLDIELAETAPYIKPPLAYKNRNAHPDIGEDVPPLPEATGLGQYRYVDPDGRLLGLDYFVGEWDKRKTIWRLAPVFSVDQPKQHAARSIARKGYAVAGAEVNVDKYVCGIRLLFQRVRADGTFDAKDAYAGQWIGSPPPGGAATKLVDDGRRVMGIHFHMGAIVDRFALVADTGAKK
jgi:RNA polymerase sigma factor (sigma-70 family)